jgi:dipeptidyl aminopeptidase/acylaminoacyl peptidase
VIYGRQAEYTSYLWRARLDRSEPERIDLAGDQAYYPSVSARGGLLAFQRNNGNRDIWRFTPTGERHGFVSSTRHESSPHFSPDGKRVVFESNRLGRLQIWTANADGSSQRPLTAPGLSGQGSPRWSPDGRSIVYDERLPEGPLGVFVIASDGSAGRFVTAGTVPFWSRDGHIYFNRSGGIWRIPATGGKDERIVPVGSLEGESPDGATLYYRKVTSPGVLFAVSRTGGSEQEVLSSVAPGGWQVVPVQDGIYFAAVSPDSPPSREIRFFDFAKRQTKRLFPIEIQNGSGLAVSPDRTTILYGGALPNDGDDLVLIRNFQ